MNSHDVVIVGGGPAGLTAGLYTSRAGLDSLLLERAGFGGQMVNAPVIENYPGFPDKISGYELGQLMHQQATLYGLETQDADVSDLMINGEGFTLVTDEGDIETSTIIIASGSEYQRLGLPGEDRFLGRGVSYCATCDGFIFRDKRVAVIGGGDTAVSDALELAEHCEAVYLIHRRDQLRAIRLLQERAFSQPKIGFIWDTVVEELIGDMVLSSLKLRNMVSGEPSYLEIDGVFVAIGVKPNSQPFASMVSLSETGHILVNDGMATSLAGVYAAGDIRAGSPRQISTAVGDGAAAAMSVFKFLKG